MNEYDRNIVSLLSKLFKTGIVEFRAAFVAGNDIPNLYRRYDAGYLSQKKVKKVHLNPPPFLPLALPKTTTFYELGGE